MRATLTVILGASLILSSGGTILAQLPDRAPRATEPQLPLWMTAWSPLDPIASLPRQLPAAPPLPRLLLHDRPRLGSLWTGGNPASLPLQVESRWNRLAVGAAFESGDFRRPMDTDEVEVVGFSGFGWEPVGSAGAAIGHVLVDQENLAAAPFADVLTPHPSNPFVMADSSAPQMRRQRARLEGGFGWRFQPLAVGLSAGLEVRDHRSEDAPFPRIGRMSRYGVTAGILRELPLAGMSVAARIRWMRNNEAMTVFAEPADGTVFLLQGFGEPARVRVGATSPFYFRRMEREAWLWGFGLNGELAAIDWTLGWESTTRDEEQFSRRQPDAPIDRWASDGWTAYAAVQRSLFQDRLLITGRARYSTLQGDARRADLTDPIFTADESAWFAEADLRYLPPDSPWMLALVGSLRRESRTRRDLLAEVAAEIESWSPGVAFEVARRIGDATTVALASGLSLYSPTWVLPNPESMGSAYRLIIAPEMALYATGSNPFTTALGIRHRFSQSAALVLEGQANWLSPDSAPEVLSRVPSGDRSLWHLLLSLVLTD